MLVVIAMALPLSAEAPGAWTLSGNLNTARANHAAATLPERASADRRRHRQLRRRRSPARKFSTCRATRSRPCRSGLPTGVSGLTATVLNDNTVLLTGGINSSANPVSAAELYNPSTSTFTKLPAMNIARSHHTATLLNNGSVLMAGGRDA